LATRLAAASCAQLTVVGTVALVRRLLLLLLLLAALEGVAVTVLGERAAKAAAGDGAVLALRAELAGLALLLVGRLVLGLGFSGKGEVSAASHGSAAGWGKVVADAGREGIRVEDGRLMCVNGKGLTIVFRL
jgi:hypothetical protein